MRRLTDIPQLGQIIRQARKTQNLTQKQLSATSGVGERFIRELEHGKTSCHIGKVLQVMTMLGVYIHIEIEGDDSESGDGAGLGDGSGYGYGSGSGAGYSDGSGKG